MNMREEIKILKHRESNRRYYLKNKEKIKAKRQAKETPQLNKDVFMQFPKIQDTYIHDFYSRQLDKIEKALWCICIAIVLIGIAIVF